MYVIQIDINFNLGQIQIYTADQRTRNGFILILQIIFTRHHWGLLYMIALELMKPT